MPFSQRDGPTDIPFLLSSSVTSTPLIEPANQSNDYPKSRLLRKGQLFHQYLQGFLRTHS